MEVNIYTDIEYIYDIPEKQLKIFLLFLQQQPLKKYLQQEKVYNCKKNCNKGDLIDMIITETDKTVIVCNITFQLKMQKKILNANKPVINKKPPSTPSKPLNS